jgi:excisionase family DNA binding protein
MMIRNSDVDKRAIDRPPECTGVDDTLRTLLREIWELKQMIATLTPAVQTDDRAMGYVEAAAYTGLSKSRLYSLVNEKKIPHHKPSGTTGGRVYFRREELDEYLYRNKTQADYEVEDRATEIVNQLRR